MTLKLLTSSQEATAEAGVLVRFAANRSNLAQREMKPLQSYQNRTDFSRYARFWQQIVIFFVRTSLVEKTSYPPYHFTVHQQECFNLFQQALRTEESDSEDTSSDDSEVGNTLRLVDVRCLSFCLSLLQHQIRTTEWESPFICALAILGVEERGWKDATVYSSILSALIKLSRFLVVHFVVREHPSSPIEGVRSFLEESLLRGTSSPFEWMLDLRAYGIKIAFNVIRPSTIDWQGDRILYQDIQFSMAEFRGFVHGLLTETHRLVYDELFLGLSRRTIPSVQWENLYDNVTESEDGWSFLQDPRNTSLLGGDIYLWDYVRTDQTLVSRYFPSTDRTVIPHSIQLYWNSVQQFRTKLCLLCHITAGQPARIPELLSVRWQNSAEGDHRNIFVENGLVSLVTRYHKGYSTTSDMRVIHRYLPREVGTILLQYLWLIQPFFERLELWYGRTTSISPFLWSPDPLSQKKWDTNRVRSAL